MYDRWGKTVDPKTYEEKAKKVQCKISPGVLTDLVVFMPEGCKGLCRCRVFLGEKPIAPRAAKRYVAGEGYVVNLKDMNERVREDLPVLNWYVWNVDTKYPHTPWLSAQWLTEQEMYERKMYVALKDFLDRWKRLTGM